MPQYKHKVEIYSDPDSITSDEPLVIDDVDFVSLVNHETHGIPALISRNYTKPEASVIGPGQKVVYVNTGMVPLYTIERLAS